MTPPPPRVLMLASYFHKPANPFMGNRALAQALALQRNGADIRVMSFTSWVPKALAHSKGSKAYSSCPPETLWNGLPVMYPRWLYYPVGLFKKLTNRYPALPMFVAWLTARHSLRKVTHSFRPQLIYAHHTAANGLLAANLHRETGLPYVVTDHDFDELQACRLWPQRRRLFEFVAEKAHAMISVAARMEAEMKRISPAAHTLTIQNGTDPLPPEILTQPRPAALRGKVVIFSCGTFYQRKAFPALVEAFARIAPVHPQAVLRIAGDGEERRLIEDAVRRHGLADRVSLLGFLPHRQVMQEMAWSDIFALIGWDEPFATVYVEAMAAGKPVLCCSDGGITDVLLDGIHGLTVPPHNSPAAAAALDRLCGDPNLRQTMGLAAQSLFNSSLKWDSHAIRMLEIFRSAIDITQKAKTEALPRPRTHFRRESVTRPAISRREIRRAPAPGSGSLRARGISRPDE